MAGCGVWGVLKLYLPAGGLGWTLGSLAEGPKMSQSRHWPTGRCGQGPGGPRADAGLLVSGLGSDMAGCGAEVVLGLLSICWWAGLGPRGSQSYCWLLVGKARSWSLKAGS